MNPAEIDRWKPELLSAVGAACGKQSAGCDQTVEALNNQKVFATWSGVAADSARTASQTLAGEYTKHQQQLQRVRLAADAGSEQAAKIKTDLAAARDFINTHQFVLDDSSGRVSLNSAQQWLVDEVTVRSPERMAEEARMAAALRDAQGRIDDVASKADAADREIAVAVERALTGDTAPITTSDSVPAPQPGQLPGSPLENSIPLMHEPGSSTTSRLVRVDVPAGFTDKSLSSDLAEKYAKPVTFDPSAPGVVGKVVDTRQHGKTYNVGAGNPDIVIPFKPDTGDMNPRIPRAPGAPASLNVSINSLEKVRADSATPTSMHAVTIDGHNYLQIDYQYNYSAAAPNNVIDVNGIKLSTTNHDTWAPLTAEQAQAVAARGVPLPTPGQ